MVVKLSGEMERRALVHRIGVNLCTGEEVFLEGDPDHVLQAWMSTQDCPQVRSLNFEAELSANGTKLRLTAINRKPIRTFIN